METVAIIPARKGSKGVPNKNMTTLIGGKPLLWWTVKAAMLAESIDRVVITTDYSYSTVSEIITDAHGLAMKPIEYYERPPALAEDWVQNDEVALYTLRELQSDGIEVETVVMLQPTSPFRTAKGIDDAVAMHDKSGRTVISGCRLRQGFYWRAVNPDYYITGDMEPIGHDPTLRGGRQQTAFPVIFKENGAIYVVSGYKLADHKVVRVPPFVPYYMDEDRSIDIDSEEDLLAAKRMEYLVE